MKADYLSKQVIVSNTVIDDGLFHESVVLIVEHNADGAFGIIFNKPTGHTLGEILLDLQLNSACDASLEPIFQGGPLGVDRGFILHSSGQQWPNTIAITEEIFLTTSTEILEDLSKDVGPTECAIALGYSSWGPGQLEQELKDNAWLATEVNRALLFGDASTAHQRAAKQIGVDLSLVTRQQGLQ